MLGIAYNETIDKFMGRNDSDKDWKNENSLLRDVFVAIASSDRKVPIVLW